VSWRNRARAVAKDVLAFVARTLCHPNLTDQFLTASEPGTRRLCRPWNRHDKNGYRRQFDSQFSCNPCPQAGCPERRFSGSIVSPRQQVKRPHPSEVRSDSDSSGLQNPERRNCDRSSASLVFLGRGGAC
jgi:hypothetical protein